MRWWQRQSAGAQSVIVIVAPIIAFFILLHA